MNWTCDTGQITKIIDDPEATSSKFEAVKYDGSGTLTLQRTTNSGTYYATVGIACTPQYNSLDVVGSGNGGNGSFTINTSTYGNDFLILGIQLDYQCTSKITAESSSSSVTITPLMKDLYSGYSQGAISAFHVKTTGSGTINGTWTANSNSKLGTTRIMVIH